MIKALKKLGIERIYFNVPYTQQPKQPWVKRPMLVVSQYLNSNCTMVQ
jgi:hypothetical protein